jgi:hypothetical protein
MPESVLHPLWHRDFLQHPTYGIFLHFPLAVISRIGYYFLGVILRIYLSNPSRRY